MKIGVYHGNSFSASQNFLLEAYHSKHMENMSEHNQHHMLLQTKYGIGRTFIPKSSIDLRVIHPQKEPNSLHFFSAFQL